jgi:hypothetical protein
MRRFTKHLGIIDIGAVTMAFTEGDAGNGPGGEELYDPSGIWDFTVSGQNVTVTITGNNWVFDGSGIMYDDTGTFITNGNTATLYSNAWNTTIGTGRLTGNTTMILTLVSPSLITGMYNGVKR